MTWQKHNGAFVSRSEHFALTVYRRIGTSDAPPGWHFIICARPAEPDATARIWTSTAAEFGGYDDAAQAIHACRMRAQAMEAGLRMRVAEVWAR